MISTEETERIRAEIVRAREFQKARCRFDEELLVYHARYPEGKKVPLIEIRKDEFCITEDPNNPYLLTSEPALELWHYIEKRAQAWLILTPGKAIMAFAPSAQ